MQRRIMGMENELGAIRRRPDGSWAPTRTSAPPLRSMLGKMGAFARRPLFLANGGCVYPDVGHVEYATPECIFAKDVVIASRGGEQWIQEHLSSYESPQYGQVIFIKDNTDSKDDVVFGCHENYLFDGAEIPFWGEGFRPEHGLPILTFLATRILFTGAGVAAVKIQPSGGQILEQEPFLLSHRARCVGATYGPGIPMGRGTIHPLITTRFEPLAFVPEMCFRRLHITCGDPNMSELVDFLKFGTMHLLLRLAEETQLRGVDLPMLERPVGALHRINADLQCRAILPVIDRPQGMRALDIQEAYLEAVAKHFPRSDDSDDVKEECNQILTLWAEVLFKLRRDPRILVRELDWVHKMILEEHWLNDHGIDGFEALQDLFRKKPRTAQKILGQLKGLEQRLHELSPRGLWRMQEQAGRVIRLTTDEEVANAKQFPPGMDDPTHRTRSWIRGMYIQWAKDHGVRYSVPQVGSDPDGWSELRLYLDGTPYSTFSPRGKGRFVLHLPDPFRWDIPAADQLLDVD